MDNNLRCFMHLSCRFFTRIYLWRNISDKTFVLVWRLSYLNWWELKAEFKRSGMAGITINCTWYVGHGRHHYKGTMISCQAESSKLRLANLGRDESAVEGQVGMESSHERRAWYVGGNMREAYNSEAQIWIRADLPPQQLPCNCHCPLPTTIIHHKSYHAISTTQRGIDGNLIYGSPSYHFHCNLASIFPFLFPSPTNIWTLWWTGAVSFQGTSQAFENSP